MFQSRLQDFFAPLRSETREKDIKRGNRRRQCRHLRVCLCAKDVSRIQGPTDPNKNIVRFAFVLLGHDECQQSPIFIPETRHVFLHCQQKVPHTTPEYQIRATLPRHIQDLVQVPRPHGAIVAKELNIREENRHPGWGIYPCRRPPWKYGIEASASTILCVWRCAVYFWARDALPLPLRRPFVQQEAVLKATAVRSPFPVMSSILHCPPCLPQVMLSEGGVQLWGVGYRGFGWGVGEGEGG